MPEQAGKQESKPQQGLNQPGALPAQPETVSPSAVMRTASSSSKALRLLSVCVLLLALIGLLSGMYLWWSLDQQQSKQQQELRALKEQLQQTGTQNRDLSAKLLSSEQKLSAQLNDLETKQQSLQQSQLSLFQVAGKRPRDWVLAEVEYLIRIADYQIQFGGQTVIASAALKSADQLLADLADPGLNDVRAQLAQDMGTLNSFHAADRTGIVLTLTQLSRRLDSLPFSAAQERAQQFNQSVTLPSPEQLKQNWSASWRGVWTELKSLVVIQKNARVITPLLNQDQRILLRENIQLNMEQAKLAAMQENEQLYQESLLNVQHRIKAYYDLASKDVNQILSQLQQLAQEKIKTQLPYVGEGIRMVREEMADRVLTRNLRLERQYQLEQNSSSTKQESVP